MRVIVPASPCTYSLGRFGGGEIRCPLSLEERFRRGQQARADHLVRYAERGLRRASLCMMLHTYSARAPWVPIGDFHRGFPSACRADVVATQLTARACAWCGHALAADLADKACIDQTNIEDSLKCLPVFLSSCEQLVVLAGPQYATRLWYTPGDAHSTSFVSDASPSLIGATRLCRDATSLATRPCRDAISLATRLGRDATSLAMRLCRDATSLAMPKWPSPQVRHRGIHVPSSRSRHRAYQGIAAGRGIDLPDAAR